MTCEIFLESVTSIILIFTLCAIIWYAIETRGLKKETARLAEESVKQTELSLRPFVVISYDEREGKFKLINFGNTPALSVKIDDVTLIETEGLRFNYVFPKIDFIPQQGKIDITNIKKKINDEISETDTFDLGALVPRVAQRTFKVLIRYKNIQGDEYVAEGKVGEGAFDFEKIEKIS